MAADSENALAEAQSLDDQHEAAAQRADLAALRAALAAGTHRRASSFELPRLLDQLRNATETGNVAALCAALAAGAATVVDSWRTGLSSKSALGRVVETKQGVDISVGRRTACVRALLLAGASASAPVLGHGGNGSHIALHDAAYLGLSTVCRLLLDAGADVNARHMMLSENYYTPLYYAATRSHGSERAERNQKAIALLLSRGAVDGPDIDKYESSSYLKKVRAAGGFSKYERQHRAMLVASYAPKFSHLLPPELVSVVISFWAHVGFY